MTNIAFSMGHDAFLCLHIHSGRHVHDGDEHSELYGRHPDCGPGDGGGSGGSRELSHALCRAQVDQGGEERRRHGAGPKTRCRDRIG